MANRCQIPFEWLVEYAENEGSADRSTEISAHLEKGCTTCLHSLAWIREVTDAMRSSLLVEVPDTVRARALRLFAQRQRRARLAVVQRVLASLAFDSRMAPSLAGVRSREAPSIQMLYSTGELDVDLDVQFSESAPRATVIGQVLSRHHAGSVREPAYVSLLSDDREVATADVDDLGEFVLQEIDPGTYDLHLVLGSEEIILAGVEIST